MWKRDGKNNRLRDDDNFTFLGKGVDFKGVVHFDGTVRIDGRLEGEIHTNGTLIVGENAVIKALISAGSLICSGKINGNVNAAEKVELMKPAVLIGDVRSPSISMEPGAHFHGMCDMGANKWFSEEYQDFDKVHDLAAHRGKIRVQDAQS
ncbi:MAG: polymer-forming cytoskeletal protein [Nitrospiraceae bacterium]